MKTKNYTKVNVITCALFAFGLSANAMAYNLQCKTSSPLVDLVIVADSADGSLDDLRIGIDGINYGENDINVANWQEEVKTYRINDSGVYADWAMKDGKTVQIMLTSPNAKKYQGSLTVSATGAADRKVKVSCKNLE